MNVNRRKFLTQSVTISAGLASLSTQHLSQERASTKYRVGIVGCGRMGQHFADVYQALPDTELVAIAEWNSERRKVVGKRYGCLLYTSPSPRDRQNCPKTYSA